MRLSFAFVICAGCVGAQPTLEVHVTDEAGAGLAGATVQAVCDEAGDGAAAYAGDDGAAHLVLFFDSGEGPCVVTVAQDGFRTAQLDGIAPCPGDDACAPIEVALGRAP